MHPHIVNNSLAKCTCADYINTQRHTLILPKPHVLITQQEVKIWEQIQVSRPLFLSYLLAMFSSNLSDFLNMAKKGLDREKESWMLKYSYQPS